MRIRAIRVGAFGALREMEVEDLSPGLISVYGPNESGKSTFRDFISSMIFGFHPANLEDHPYTPWAGTEMSGRMGIELQSGEMLEVHRKLRTTPSGSTQAGDVITKLANRPLPSVSGRITRELFHDVYTLSRSDLEFPGRTWKEVKDRIIGGSGLENVRPARVVAGDLETEGNNLWRPDRKGKPQAVRLRSEIKKVNDQIRDATVRDKEVRDLESGMLRLQDETAELLEKKSRLAAKSSRAARLAPAKKQIARIRVLQEKAGDLAPFRDLSPDPGGRMKQLHTEIGRGEEKKGVQRREGERLKKAIDRMTPSVRLVSKRRGDIQGAVESAIRLQSKGTHLENLEKKRERLDLRVREKSRTLLKDEKSAFSLSGLSLHELGLLVTRYRVARDRADARSDDAILPLSSAVSFLLPLFLVLAGAAALLSLVPLRFSPLSIVLAAAGLILIVVGGVLGGTALASRRLSRGAAARGDEEWSAGRFGEEDDKACLKRIHDLLEGIPFLSTRLDSPDEMFLRELSELHSASEEWRDANREAEEVRAWIEEKKGELLSFAGECGVEETDPGTAVRLLEERLEVAKEAERKAAEAEERFPLLHEEMRSNQAITAELELEKGRIEETLARIDGDNLAARVEILEERRSAAHLAEEMIREIEKGGDSLAGLEREIESMEKELILSDEEMARLEEELNGVTDGFNRKRTEISVREEKLKHLTEEPGSAELEGRRDSMQEEISELERERDRLFVLAGIIREADRRYRVEHEPDIVKRTGEIFARITEGRYDSLSLEQEEGEGIHIHSKAATDFLPAGEPISRGTLDQLFLSLRLALVGHLEAGGETIPLFLDEILAHWDDRRLDEGLGVLSGIAEERQVFCFTCRRSLHEAMLECGASSLELKVPK